MAVRMRPRGPFSLASAGSFAEQFPGTRAVAGPDALHYAWAVDGDWRAVEVTLTQPHELVIGEFSGQPGSALARRARGDLEAILSLDVDGTDFGALGRRDPVVGALQQRFPGLRPVLFYTPYEAAAWAIIGQRIRMTQAARIKDRLAVELGDAGAFPGPERLAEIGGPQPGLTDRKLGQLRALAAAAADGRLGRDHLRGMEREQALTDLQELPGIGPFGAELILIRGAGDPDFFPVHEPRVAGAVRAACGLPDDADVSEFVERWRPFRAWVGVLMRVWLQAGAVALPQID